MKVYRFSAPSLDELERTTRSFAASLRPPPPAASGPFRRVVVAEDPAQAARRLKRGKPAEVFTASPAGTRPVVLMFSGVGDQYPGVAAGLYHSLAVFRTELDRCLHRLEGELGTDLRAILYPADGTPGTPGLAALFDQRSITRPIHRTAVAQPLAFALQYALGRALLSLGIRPHALAGYSVGEYVAGCLAGVFTLEDALHIVAERARLVAALPEGAMLAVMAPPDAAFDLPVAALDGPALTVLAGPPHAVEELGERLMEKGVASRRLATAHAFHSPMMDPVVEPLRELISTIRLTPPSTPFLSNVTGTWITGTQATDPSYWADHLRRTIRFADNLAELARLPDPVTIEVGPGRTLTGLVRHGLALRTLPGVYETRTDREIFLTTAGRLWTAGVDIDWPEGSLGWPPEQPW